MGIAANRPETPVYLFTGFLDSGKTTFVQGTMDDPAFNGGEENTLILLCEEGEVELDVSKFASDNVTIVTIDDEEELTSAYLTKLQDETGCDRVVVEYNGLWLLDTLYRELPENWVIYQEMCLMDAKVFLTYNTFISWILITLLRTLNHWIVNQFYTDLYRLDI